MTRPTKAAEILCNMRVQVRSPFQMMPEEAGARMGVVTRPRNTYRRVYRRRRRAQREKNRFDGLLGKKSDGLLGKKSDGLLGKKSDGLLGKKSDGLLGKRVMAF